MNVGDEFYYSVVNRSGNEAEVGYGSLALNGATYELVRTSVIRSTNGNGLVNFTNGNKEVSLAYTAAQFAQIETQVSAVTSLAEAMTSLAAVTSVAAEHATSSALVASSAALVATSAEGVAVSSALFAAAQASLAAAYTSAVLASGAAAASTPFFLVSSPSTVAFNKSRVLNFVSSNFDSTDNGGGGTYDVSLKPTLLDPVLLSATAKTRFIVETTADVSVGNFVRIAATSVAVSVLTPTSVTGGSYASITLTGTTTLPGSGQITSGGSLTIGAGQSITAPTITTASGPLALQSANSQLALLTGAGSAYLYTSSGNTVFQNQSASSILFKTNAGTTQFSILNASSAVNYPYVRGSITNNPIVWGNDGSDANISSYHTTKGSGSHFFYTNAISILQFAIAHVASADTYLVAAGFQGASGSGPRLFADSSVYSNTDLVLGSKGSGYIDFGTNASTSAFTRQFRIAHAALAVNCFSVSGSATGAPLYITATGSDANISAYLRAKGSGYACLVDGSGNRGILVGTSTLGFFENAGATKQTVTGSRGGNAALASLLTALAAYGLLTDSSTA